jgi:hypothetical protein
MYFILINEFSVTLESINYILHKIHLYFNNFSLHGESEDNFIKFYISKYLET